MAAGRGHVRDSCPPWASPPAGCSRSRSSRAPSRIGCLMLVSSLLLSLGVYGVGLMRLWRHAGYGRGIRPLDALAFGTGWLALAIALSPPLDEWSEQWLAAHMVQHELLMVVAAPLIAVGAPVVGMLWALPARARHAVIGTVQRTPLPILWRAITAPPSAFLLYGVALWVWHIPALYDNA